MMFWLGSCVSSVTMSGFGRYCCKGRPIQHRNLLGHCVADTVPDLIFQSNQRRRRESYRWFCSLHPINDEIGNVYFAVRIVRIAFAISAEQCRARSRNLEESFDHSCLAQIAHQQVALGVDVGRDVMGYLPRIVSAFGGKAENICSH